MALWLIQRMKIKKWEYMTYQIGRLDIVGKGIMM